MLALQKKKARKAVVLLLLLLPEASVKESEVNGWEKIPNILCKASLSHRILLSLGMLTY